MTNYAIKGVRFLDAGPNFFNQEGTDTPKYAASAQAVALYAFRKLMLGKTKIIPGIVNMAQQFLPKKLLIWIIATIKQ